MGKGIQKEHLDVSISPSRDFYSFVNGGWMKKTEIPEDRSSWGSFHELAKATDEKVIQLLKEELDRPGPAENKAARLFESGMDLERIEAKKLGDLREIFSEISAVNNHHELIILLGKLLSHGFGGIMHFSVHADLGNSKVYAAYLEPGILGLPERDFYFEMDEKSLHIRAEYMAYIQHLLLHEAGLPKEDTAEIANSILELETGLASKMLPKEERRRIELLYNPHSLDQLKQKFQRLDWEAFFQSMHISNPEKIIVTEPDYFNFLNDSLKDTSLDTIKAYLTFLVVHHAATFAHAALEKAHFNLFHKTLEGVQVMKPRHERIVKVTNLYLGEALGQLFVAKHFPPEAKSTALEMVSDIVEAFRRRILQLDWMSDHTKQYALEKLNSFRVKIGYPDVWKDYSSLQLSPAGSQGSYLADMVAVAEWKFKKDTGRIGQEVDREEWFMAPQVVNAYYNPMFNEIVFPAAILQPPFFDWEADAAINYGGIGAVIGHEITHGFDDQGSRFDKDGNLNEWWTAEDRDQFMMRADQLILQFNAYMPFDDLPLNGEFTLGENIADLGGLSVAYDALQLYYARHGKPGLIDGFTPDQRFFMSWATVWRTKVRPEALRTQIKTDPHPPGQYRAIAAPSNLDKFYQAFDIHRDSPIFRREDERIRIW